MKIVRVDHIVPDGMLELHPRLTVLSGAAPEVQRRLRNTMEAIVGDGDLEGDGLIEVNGVQLALDAATISQLRIDEGIDPVLRLADTAAPGAPTAAEPAADAPPAPTGPAPSATTPPPFAHPPSDAGGDPDRDELREQLRAVSARRTALGEEMEATRSGLDSFSTAALEVCIGQIDALESRRNGLRDEWEQERARLQDRRNATTGDLDRLRAVVAWVQSLDVEGVQDLRDRLARAAEQRVEPDVDADTLADRLDASMERVRDLVSRQAAVALRESEAAQRLEEALAEATSAERELRSHRVDQSVVRRLEAVRDEIFAVDDRSGRLGAARNKRRLSELRSEEAMLLDRLGFDTYSAYVMGIPSVRAEMERSSKFDSAQDRADRIVEEIERLREEAPNPAEIAIASSELEQLLAHSLEHLGMPTPQRSLDSLVDGLMVNDGTADEVYSTIAALRRRRLEVQDTSEIDELARALRERLVVSGPAWGGLRAQDPPAVTPFGSSTPPPTERRRRLDPPPVAPFASVAASAEPAELVEFADAWLRWTRALGDWLVFANAIVEDLELAVADLEARSSGDGIARWAEVEAELDAALDRLAVAQERVRAHEEATAELARALCELELELRDTERTLLAAVAAGDRFDGPAPSTPPASGRGDALRPPPFTVGGSNEGLGGWSDPAPPSAGFEPESTEGGSPDPDSSRGDSTEPVSVSAAPSEDLEWSLIARMAEQRSVSFVGSIPMLVDGLPGDESLRVALLERLDRMSDLIQVVVLSDDEGVSASIESVGSRARCIQL